MKAELIGKKWSRLRLHCRLVSFLHGFSTIEVVVACAIVTLALASAAAVSFGAQSLVLDGELYLGALSKLEAQFEKLIFIAPDEFNTIVSSATEDGWATSTVLDITPCIKKVSLNEEWQNGNKVQGASLIGLLTFPRFVKERGEPCRGPELYASEWEEYSANSSGLDVTDATDIDVVGDTVFLSFNASTTAGTDFAIADVASLAIFAELDLGAGIFSIDVANSFVYVARNATSSQLAVLDVSDPLSPVLVAERNLAAVDPSGSYPEARSIAYHDSKVYVGTKETAGPELHVFDVSDPQNPIELGHLELTHNINDIAVRDGFAFLATSSDSEELIVVDVHDPAHMIEVGSFNAGTSITNDRDGTSVYLLGNTLYLGRKKGGMINPDFYAIDITNPASPSLLGSFSLGLSVSTDFVSTIIVSSGIAFVSTTDDEHGFFVLDVSDLSEIKLISTADFTQALSGLDIYDGALYGVEPDDDSVLYKIMANQ